MQLVLVNNSSISMPRKFIQLWTKEVARNLGLRGSAELTIVFTDAKAARKINRQFRKRDYATDILSFQSEDLRRSWGELVLCPQVLQKQARDHDHSFRAEVGYMLIHGVLHLLGHDHEGRGPRARRQAEKMFKLQDQLFDSLCAKFHV